MSMKTEIHGTIDLNETQKSVRDTFSEEVYENLPPILKTLCSKLKGNDREVFFAGSLATLSSILPNLQFTYDGKVFESNLYLFLLGQFGSGKSALSYSANLVEPVHDFLRSTEQPSLDGLPTKKNLLFLPANSSKSGLIELLSTFGRGLLFEPESDTLADQMNQDYANFSDVLRVCYQHEMLRFYRRNQKEYYEIKRPKLSVLISGTPGQLRKLIPSIESGLFSRFLFFKIEPEIEFKDVFSNNGTDLSKYFISAGKSLLPLFTWLNERSDPFTYSLTEEQKHSFVAYFKALKHSLIETFGMAIDGSVNRFGSQFVRISLVLSALRAASENLNFEPLICTDQDYENTGRIMEVFISHQNDLFSEVQSDNSTGHPENKKNFLSGLPQRFTTSQAMEVAQLQNLSERTVKYWLSDRKLFNYLSFGNYSKK